jgi:hypothetical protein
MVVKLIKYLDAHPEAHTAATEFTSGYNGEKYQMVLMREGSVMIHSIVQGTWHED